MIFWLDSGIIKQTVNLVSSYRHRLLDLVLLMFCSILQGGCGDDGKRIRVPAVELFHQAFIAYEEKYYQEAEQKFQALADEHPNTRLATLAYLKMGDLNFERSKWQEAESNYRMFLTLNPQSHLTPYVLNRIIALNYERNLYGLFFPTREFDRNMEPNRTILQEYRRFYLIYPQSPYLEEVRNYLLKARADLAEHEFLVGNYYFRGKHYHSAIERYLHLLMYFPEFPRIEEVAWKLVKAYRLNKQPRLAEEMQTVMESFKEQLALTGKNL